MLYAFFFFTMKSVRISEGDDMLKKILLCLILLVCGCEKQKSKDVEVEPFTITFYYLEYCSYCEAAKKYFVPEVEKEFGDAVTFEYVSLDTVEGETAYIELMGHEENGEYIEGKLKDVPKEVIDEGVQGPLFVIEDDYAFLGYDKAYHAAYIEDMYKAFSNQELGNIVSEGRYVFK